MIRLKVTGIQEVRAAIRKFGEDAKIGVANAVTATALIVDADVKKAILRGPKTGRVYTEIFRTIGGRPVPVGPRSGNNLSASHQASAPGEAPATDTGRLASSVLFTQEARFSASVGSSLAYANWLEFGTRRIKPRPAWTPAAEKNAPELQRRVAAALVEAMP